MLVKSFISIGDGHFFKLVKIIIIINNPIQYLTKVAIQGAQKAGYVTTLNSNAKAYVQGLFYLILMT